MMKQPLVKTLGSRKRATARVWLYRGKGDWLINEKKLEDYFFQETAQIEFRKPFVLVKAEGKYHGTIKVKGGGKKGQLGAIKHGFARALDQLDREAYHDILKQAGLLTRDSREKERRKPGRAHSARAKRSSPKR